MIVLILAVVVLVLLAARRPLVYLVRFVFADRPARRHYLPALWHTCGPRWRWLTRSAGLAQVERVHSRIHRLLPVRPFATSTPVSPGAHDRLRWPRITRLRIDAYGWQVQARTVPKCGRAEIAKASQYIADQWQAHRVAVTQVRPGYVAIRAMRVDPVTEAYPLSLAPAGVYAIEPLAPRPWRWYLGRDEYGAHRFVPLAHLPAFTVGGMPGFGKTVLMSSLLCQVGPSPLVALAGLLDGKAGGDYDAWAGRAELVCGDDLADATDVLAEIHRELRRRLAAVLPELGVRNAWAVGPSAAWPYKVTIMDEAHTYLDLDRWKGDPKAERLVRQCRMFTSDLVRKGRSCLMLTALLSQHITTDTLPSGIRDAAPLALSFATRTTEKSVAALGAEIRDWPDFDPVHLASDEYRGVLVAGLRTGLDPYVRVRVPEITEAYAAERAAAVAIVAPHRRAALPPENASPPALRAV